jgi:hypothetical protein
VINFSLLITNFCESKHRFEEIYELMISDIIDELKSEEVEISNLEESLKK